MAIRSHVDEISLQGASGWACNTEDPSRAVHIEARVAGALVASGLADGYRQDLLAAQVGTGYHGFVLHFGQSLTPDEAAKLEVFATDSDGQTAQLFLPKVEPTATSPRNQPGDSQSMQLRRLLKNSVGFAASNPIGATGPVPADLGRAPDISASLTRSAEMRGFIGKCGATVDSIVQALSRDSSAIPAALNREGYAAGRDLAYWLSGYCTYVLICRFASEYGVHGGRYLDFGGSSGRVYRHFASQSDSWSVWACDFKLTSVEFGLRFLPRSIKLFANTSYPALPLPDGYFDLVSACSVFTHIDQYETAWLLELRRILRIGGIACLTVQNDDAWGHPHVVGSIKKLRPELLEHDRLPSGKTVMEFRDDDPYYCTVMHSNDYIHNVWGRFFEICTIAPRQEGAQAMVICRRTD